MGFKQAWLPCPSRTGMCRVAFTFHSPDCRPGLNLPQPVTAVSTHAYAHSCEQLSEYTYLNSDTTPMLSHACTLTGIARTPECSHAAPNLSTLVCLSNVCQQACMRPGLSTAAHLSPQIQTSFSRALATLATSTHQAPPHRHSDGMPEHNGYNVSHPLFVYTHLPCCSFHCTPASTPCKCRGVGCTHPPLVLFGPRTSLQLLNDSLHSRNSFTTACSSAGFGSGG